MRLKAKTNLKYAGKQFRAGQLFDALEDAGRTLINQDKAEPFNLEDPSTRDLQDMVENLLPDVPPVTISPDNDSFGPIGGNGSFSVTITGPGQSGTWSVDQDAADTWLSVTFPTSPQAEDGAVTYDVAANSGAARSTHMYINGKTFTISQTGLP